jgi:hypothetical protein
MRKRSKIILAALTATLLMALASGFATAQRLSISNRNIRLQFRPLRFTSRESEATISCNVTLEGSFHSATIHKVRGALIGHISRASVASCGFGTSATVLTASLPWHITYDSFIGRLPRLEAVVLLLHRTAFRVDTLLTPACLYQEDGRERARGIANVEPNGLVTSVAADREISMPLFEGPAECFRFGGFEGSAELRLLGSNTQNISIRLI